MNICVIIPTRPDDDRVVARCVDSVLPQLQAGDELVISVDGPIRPGHFAETGATSVLQGPTAGPGVARNRAMRDTDASLLLFLNDDVIASPDLLELHRSTHADTDRAAMVLGAAPWRVPTDDLVVDRLLRETSMIFFYDQMTDSDRDRDWGFRHAWTLNLSVPRSIALEYDERLRQPMFDDLEWAYRIQNRYGSPVLFRPEARVTHDHRYTPEKLLRREAVLGHQALSLMRANAACGGDVFASKFYPEESKADQHEQMAKDCANEAKIAFDLFASVAMHPSESISDMELRDLYQGARTWRTCARSIGFAGAFRDQTAAQVQARVSDLLATTAALDEMQRQPLGTTR